MSTQPGVAPLYWIQTFAHARGLRYEAEADERWLRAWEPYTTLRTPIRYEHALLATGTHGSISIARAVVELPGRAAHMASPTEAGTWIAIVQDVRLTGRAAVTSDFGGIFSESPELVAMPRSTSGDRAFDQVFATFATSAEQVASAVTPSLRKLLLSWRAPVHAEVRPGGFVLAPVSAPADERGLAWVVDAVHVFGDKATKLAARG